MTITTATINGVSKRFRRTLALDDVSLELKTGVTGLLGPNGAGKTTLLRIMATILAPDRGGVQLLGHSIDRYDERKEVRRRLGYLPQELEYPRGFTAFGFVDYMAILKEWDDQETRYQEVRRVLDLVQLGDLSTKKIKALSGGMRRRLAIAQALIGAPELLLLDEPTSGLDPEQRVSLRSVISQIPATVLLSTHQTEDVEALCDRVIVLDEGRVLFDGAVTDLVATAAGSVWLADEPDPDALAHWKTGSGRYRHVGRNHSGETVSPTLEDAYLLMRNANTQLRLRKKRTETRGIP
jgi:ABC-2 type transport system ATP-binding protein